MCASEAFQSKRLSGYVAVPTDSVCKTTVTTDPSGAGGTNSKNLGRVLVCLPPDHWKAHRVVPDNVLILPRIPRRAYQKAWMYTGNLEWMPTQ